MNARYEPASNLSGEISPPPDKSISHRAALLGAMSAGPVRIRNYLEAADTRSMLGAVQAVGATVEEPGDEIVVTGPGLREARESAGTIDVGNAGTVMRLLSGWLAVQEGREWRLDGDDSIRRRPVDRIAEPLRQMGAEVDATDGRFPPFTVRGAHLRAIAYDLPVASAQVKSCVLLAGLAAEGATTVREPAPSRDHTERMLARAGVAVRRSGNDVTVGHTDELNLGDVDVPADMSSAAFAIAAGVLVPGSRLVVRDVNVNWTRAGFVHIARRMGAAIEGELEDDPGEEIPREEPVGDLEVASGPLQATVVEPDEVPLCIDELPLVALLGCFAEGETVVRGAQELRVKESDRIATVVDGLSGLGGRIEATEDGFVVTGHRRPARRHASPPRRPPPGDARRDRRDGLARGRRGRGDGGGRSLLSRLRGRLRRAGLMLVAIDGPAGAGKSTVARAVAQALGFTYLDSGAMYRCVALAGDRDAASLDIAFEGERVLLDGEDVSEAIRTPEISQAASRKATDPAVRAAMVAKQRELLRAGDWVAEGRDIGTVVAPRRRGEGLADRRPRRARPAAGDHGRGPARARRARRRPREHARWSRPATPSRSTPPG